MEGDAEEISRVEAQEDEVGASELWNLSRSFDPEIGRMSEGTRVGVCVCRASSGSRVRGGTRRTWRTGHLVLGEHGICSSGATRRARLSDGGRRLASVEATSTNPAVLVSVSWSPTSAKAALPRSEGLDDAGLAGPGQRADG